MENNTYVSRRYAERNVEKGTGKRAEAADVMSALDTLIRDKTLIRGLVTGTNYNKQDKAEEMIVRLPEGIGLSRANAVIRREDADNVFRSGTVNYLVGQIVPFVIIGEEDGKVLASRKIAQDILCRELEESFRRKDIFDAEILSFTVYGAFVSVDGVVGMLRNADFSLDHTPVEDVYKAGDHIRVFCKSIVADSGKLYFEPEMKYHRTEDLVLDFSVGSVKIGKIVSLKVFADKQYAFVRVAKGVDVMAAIPEETEAEVGENCKVQITAIKDQDSEYEPIRVKGIVRGMI